MEQMIFVNLPVTDLARSKAFYEAIGAVNNPQFTDDTAAMMSFSQAVNVMILTHERFSSFTSRTIIDARTSAQAMFALSRDSRAAVDTIVDTAAGAGGSADPNPKQEHGEAMYGRSFTDPDGHIWEVMWMDAEAIVAQMAEQHAPA
ncbi:MAG: VOC family protein [Sphingomonas sp.]